jgi:hypothetical protein
LLGILLYDFAVKVPPMMGVVRASNFLIGALSWRMEVFEGAWLRLPPDEWQAYVWPAVGILVYGTSLTFVSTLEDVALRKSVLWLGAAGMIVGALLPTAVVLPEYWRGLGPAGLLILWVLYRALNAKDKKGVMLMVRDGVAGFILLDASIVLRHQDPILALGIAALLIPAFGLVAVFKRLA